jgi:hypothetical protein
MGRGRKANKKSATRHDAKQKEERKKKPEHQQLVAI